MGQRTVLEGASREFEEESGFKHNFTLQEYTYSTIFKKKRLAHGFAFVTQDLQIFSKIQMSKPHDMGDETYGKIAVPLFYSYNNKEPQDQNIQGLPVYLKN